MKTALILGVSGQDGAYLAQLLVAKGYLVHGTSRDAAAHPFTRLELLGIRGLVLTHTLATTDRDAVRRLLAAVRPDEIYNLSGLSSVARSFTDPASAWASITDAHALLLESARELVPAARIYHSASSECFGDLGFGAAADERTPFAPLSPYAEAKAAAHRVTEEFRARGLFACSGIVFNHESPLRPETFVTRKIVAGAAAIAAGLAHELPLGDLSASRDWGYAAEYVDAMWRMLQQREPADFVLATGESRTVEDFAAAAFEEFGLDHRRHVTVDRSLLRRAELRYSRGDASRAKRILGWEARTRFRDLVRLLVSAEQESRTTRHAVSVPCPQATT